MEVPARESRKGKIAFSMSLEHKRGYKLNDRSAALSSPAEQVEDANRGGAKQFGLVREIAEVSEDRSGRRP